MSITKVSDNMRDTTTLDATKLSGDLPAISGASLTGVGKVLQVVTSSALTSRSTTTSQTLADVTGMSVAITPASSSNKVLVQLTGTWLVTLTSANWNAGGLGALLRDSTQIAEWKNYRDQNSAVAEHNHAYTFCSTILDSPATAGSAVTYKMQFAKSSSYTYTVYCPMINTTQYYNHCRIVAMEIAG